MKKNSKNNSISIPKKAMLGIGGAIAVVAVLLSKNKTSEVLLFLIGIFSGVFIALS